jgi:hypothetical protein
MKRLSVLTISLCVALAVLCSAAIARGRTLPAEPDLAQVLGLDLCGGEPCIHGFTPGRISWDNVTEATKRFATREVRSDSRCIRVESDSARNKIQMCTNMAMSSLANIWLDVGQTDVPVAAFIQKYGYPCAVEVAPDGQPHQVLYSGFVVAIRVDSRKVTGHFGPALLVTRVTLLDPRQLEYGCTWRSTERKGWHGFANYAQKP